MIVVAILGIIGAMAAPSLGPNQSAQLVAAARLIAADLEYAQTCSMARRGEDLTGVLFYGDGSGYRLGNVIDDVATPMINPANRLAYEVTFGEGRADGLERITISSTDLNDEDHLAFDVFGGVDQASTDDVVITLAAGDMRLDITVTAENGQITIGDFD